MKTKRSFDSDPTQFPPPLRGVEKGSFAEYTMSERLPDIARRVAKEADLSPAAREGLNALAADMPDGVLRPIRDEGAPDVAQWSEWMGPFLGQTWLEAPWFPAETYFFRRILEATGYFRPGPDQAVDPYRGQKLGSYSGVAAQLEPVCARLEASGGDLADTITKLLHTVIWGNQADLSIWPAGSEPPANHAEAERAAHLLADQAREAADFLLGAPSGLGRVDFILDNVGLELAYDLLLADFLLENGLAAQVRFHAKPYPTYVSDATIPDIRELADFLFRVEEKTVAGLGYRLRAHLSNGRLQLRARPFWISPLVGWEMPGDLRAELGEAGLIVSKGDANYRRWLGDRHWPFTKPIQEIIAYWPAPLLLIRVLKSEMVGGLADGLAETMDRKDPNWLYDGNWGVIQFIP